MVETLAVLPVERTTKSYRGIKVRKIKMLAPRCEECQEKGLRNWWERCSHNPYFSPTPRTLSVPVLACAVCGEEVESNTAVHCGQRKYEVRGTKDSVQYEMVANTREIEISEGDLSGRRRAKQESKGWVLPETLGIAPMCEFQGCWQPLKNEKGKWLPGVRQTPWGNFCGDTEARIIGFAAGPEAPEVHNQPKRTSQLRSIDVG